ncbi:MAG: polyprenyl synthetase family protein [Gammaproteobacteria bacterium]
MSFEILTQDWLARVEQKLDQVLPPAGTSPARLHEAMRYSVLGGGKRIRPVLIYATGTALDVPLVKLDGPAAAIELMHAFSLVHDDLPAMDDDDLRRGKPTTHIKYDEATAILAADALQPLAFGVLATDADMDCAPEVRLQLIELLADACGSTGMTGGQSIDLSAEGKQLSPDELENMYQLKTGRLLQASIKFAAICACADESTTTSLSRFADDLGLAFQIRDDVLDIEGETDVIGKQQGADIDRHKATWPALFGIDTAKQKTQELLDKALAEIDDLGPQADGLRNIARFIVQREL